MVVVWSVFGLGRKMEVELFGLELVFGQKEEGGWKQRKGLTSCVWKETQVS